MRRAWTGFWNCSKRRLEYEYREGLDCSKIHNAVKVKAEKSDLLDALKACSSLRDLATGKLIHASGIGTVVDIYVGNSLVNMYAKCGSMVEARSVFDRIPLHSSVSWNSLMLGYIEIDQAELALELFSGIREPDVGSLLAALKACISLASKEEGISIDQKIVKKKSLEKGRAVHARARNTEYESDIRVKNTLLDMYAKCGSIMEALEIFDHMIDRSVVSWTVIILGCAEHRQEELALELFSRMQRGGSCLPDARVYVAALKACINLAEAGDKTVKTGLLEKGMNIHTQAAKNNSDTDIYVASALIDMYAKCGSMVDAQGVFDKMVHPDKVLWTVLILGYVESGNEELALSLFSQMQLKGCKPDARTFVAAIKACTNLAAKEEEVQLEGQLVKLVSLDKGIAIHNQVAKYGLEADVFVSSSLVGMYARCGNLVDAKKVFDSMRQFDVVSWNSLMLGYVDHGEAGLALDLFSEMKVKGYTPDARSFVAALKATASLAAREAGVQNDGKLVKADQLQKGIAIHQEAARNGFESDIFVANTLVDMYAKCGSLVEARKVFDKIQKPSVVSWNALMVGFVENDAAESALELFLRMRDEGQLEPDSRTFLAALKACSKLAEKEEGSEVEGRLVKAVCLKRIRELHSQAAASSCDMDIKFANTLLDGYAKCGSMADARRVFEGIDSHSIVSWNSLLLGYVENEEPEVALELFELMRLEGKCFPDARTFVAALKASGMALEAGKAIHGETCRLGLENNPVIQSCMTDFYAKLGSLAAAQQAFDIIPTEQLDIATWNALIGGYSRQGDAERVFELFHGLQQEGLVPNCVTFVCVLTACSHAGLVDEGKACFEAMVVKYGLKPELDHYHCLIDLLGRGNQIEAAVRVAKTMMSFKPSSVTWITVLGACRKWKNVNIGRMAFESLLEIDETDASAYMLMSNLYGSCEMWEEQAAVEAMRLKRRAWRRPARSWWCDDSGKQHSFIVGDFSHPQSEEICAKLKQIVVRMKLEAGYRADVSSVPRRLSGEEKEQALCGHSERMAIGCALINTFPGRTVRIMKNLRVCDDCHAATAIISKLEQRIIVCRDSSRFHIFENGSCTCGDFW